MGAIKDIAIDELTITRNVLGETEPVTEDVEWTGGKRNLDTGVVTPYTFDTGDFVNVNGYYDIVIKDVFGNIHTLTFVIDAITLRDIKISLEYYLEEVSDGRKITAGGIDAYWFNKDIIIKAIISTESTAPFVADDIFHVRDGGTFTVNEYAANVDKTLTNYKIHGYQFNDTNNRFEVLITVEQNQGFVFNFTDRYGNELTTHNKSITKIDKEAPVIYRDSNNESNIISNNSGFPTDPLTITINASTMYNDTPANPGFSADFTNNYLLGTSGVTLTSGTFKLIGEDRPTGNNAGFHENGIMHSYYITYKKSDNTLIGTINGVNNVIGSVAATNIFDTVSEELFKGNSIIIEIILQDYFPLVDSILDTTVDGRLHGNPTYAKVQVNVVDDVKPIIFSKTEPTILSQQADLSVKYSRSEMLTNYVDYIWDNSIEGYTVDAAEFTFSGDTATADGADGITVTVIHDITPQTPKKYHSIFVNAEDLAGNSAEQKTYNYEVTRRKVLVEIDTDLLEKTYGDADDLKVVNVSGMWL